MRGVYLSAARFDVDEEEKHGGALVTEIRAFRYFGEDRDAGCPNSKDQIGGDLSIVLVRYGLDNASGFLAEEYSASIERDTPVYVFCIGSSLVSYVTFYSE